MPVSAEFGYEVTGNTVPYPRLWKGIRTNAGFVDLRGHPERVADIHEATNSPGLTALLRFLATNARWHSVGCDLGEKEDLSAGTIKYRAGGYVQIINSNFALPSEEYESLGERIFAHTENGADVADEWHLQFSIRPVMLKIDVTNDEYFSLWIWFHCYGDNMPTALASRERFLELMGQFFSRQESAEPPFRELSIA
jgi:hypothetical protein